MDTNPGSKALIANNFGPLNLSSNESGEPDELFQTSPDRLFVYIRVHSWLS